MTDEEVWQQVEDCDHHFVPVKHGDKWYVQCERCEAYVAPPLEQTN